MKQIKQRYSDKKEEPSIKELRAEVNYLKEQVKEVKSRLNKIEIDALAQQFFKNAKVSLKGKESVHSDNEERKSKDPQSTLSSPRDETDTGNTDVCISMITKVRPQSSHVIIKLVVNSNFVLNKIALLDSGADRSCIVKV